MSNSVFVEFRLTSYVASNRCPFITFLSLGNRKKSHDARSGEYGGCCNTAKHGAVFGQKLLHMMWSVCGRTVVVQEPSPSRHFSGRFLFKLHRMSPRRSHRHPLSLALSVSCYCETTVLTLAIISLFLDVDGRPERGSLSTEVLPSLNRRNQSNTCVRPIASSPYACCNNWYVSVAVFPISKQNSMQMRCSALSHNVKIAMT